MLRAALLASLLSLFSAAAEGSAPPLSFLDFVGSYRVVRCAEHLNGVPQPGTDICDIVSFPRLVLAQSGGGYELRFYTAGGDAEVLPPYLAFRSVTPTYVDEASFSGTEAAAVWMRRKTWTATGQLARQVSVVFARAADGVPVLTLNDLDAEIDPNRHLRRRFTLRRAGF